MEYWRTRAEYYPYIKRSDAYDDFFLRGVTCHPRLSDYPMCKDVIRDYFVCKDGAPFLQLWNVCAPLKEQMSACINEVFIKNHKRGDKKFNENRKAFFESQREKKLSKMLEHIDRATGERTKLQD
jgi:hypothetical protein